MKLIPQNDNVLCTCVTSDNKTTSTGFIYKSNDIKLYKVESIGPNVKIPLKIGDSIITNSIGTKAKLGEVDYYFFKEENIMGKVI